MTRTRTVRVEQLLVGQTDGQHTHDHTHEECSAQAESMAIPRQALAQCVWAWLLAPCLCMILLLLLPLRYSDSTGPSSSQVVYALFLLFRVAYTLLSTASVFGMARMVFPDGVPVWMQLLAQLASAALDVMLLLLCHDQVLTAYPVFITWITFTSSLTVPMFTLLGYEGWSRRQMQKIELTDPMPVRMVHHAHALSPTDDDVPLSSMRVALLHESPTDELSGMSPSASSDSACPADVEAAVTVAATPKSMIRFWPTAGCMLLALGLNGGCFMWCAGFAGWFVSLSPPPTPSYASGLAMVFTYSFTAFRVFASVLDALHKRAMGGTAGCASHDWNAQSNLRLYLALMLDLFFFLFFRQLFTRIDSLEVLVSVEASRLSQVAVQCILAWEPSYRLTRRVYRAIGAENVDADTGTHTGPSLLQYRQSLVLELLVRGYTGIAALTAFTISLPLIRAGPNGVFYPELTEPSMSDTQFRLLMSFTPIALILDVALLTAAELFARCTLHWSPTRCLVHTVRGADRRVLFLSVALFAAHAMQDISLPMLSSKPVQ